MTRAEALIGSIIGPGKAAEAVLAEVTERAAGLIEEDGTIFDEWKTKRNMFQVMSQESGKKPETLRKAAERAAYKVWSVLESREDEMRRIIGRKPAIRPYPQEIVLYLAYYLKFQKPYFEYTLEQLKR